jgi:hypothetical protein
LPSKAGAQAINKVMRNNPAMFLKLLVLLVPREMQIEHSGGIKAMTTEQIERSIELIKEMLAEREAGANAKVIEGVAEKPRKREQSLAERVLSNAKRTRKPRATHSLGTDQLLRRLRLVSAMHSHPARCPIADRVSSRFQ